MRILFVPIFILFCSSLFGSIDLEDGIQDFVLETRKLEVPGYPHAFNPSIIRWDGKLLMSFRFIPDRNRSFNSELGVIWLDEDFLPISEPQILNLRPAGVSPAIPSRAEDGRLIKAGESLYLVYDDNRDEKITRGGFRVYVAELEVDNEIVRVKHAEAITEFEGASQDTREKSWVPFEYQQELLLAYSVAPHRIFRYLPGTGSCETFAETNPRINWNWGVLRGGTQALKYDDKHYLSFFHSSIKIKTIHSNDQEILHYFIGAYTFSVEPPFHITQISPEPIVGKNFYHGEVYQPYWHPIRAVFPVGYIADEKTISIFYGRQDHEIWVVKLDQAGLMKSLIPVQSQ